MRNFDSHPVENTLADKTQHNAQDAQILTFQSLAVTLRTTRFNIQKFYMALALRCMFCTDIRTDSDICFIHH
jgi:hypothetical protein